MTRIAYPRPRRAAKVRSPLSRKARPRARRKGTRAALKRKCDRLWSLIIRASNGGKCKLAGQDHVRCGGPIQGAHCFGRGHHSVRLELWNGVPLCAGHHVFYTHNYEAWQEILRTKIWDRGTYNTYWRRAQEIARPDYAWYATELQRVLDGTAA